MMRAIALLVGIFGLFSSRSASASDYPEEYVKRPQVVTQGMVQLRGDLGINFSYGSEFKPFILAPSVDYGATDDLQLSLYHESSFCLNDCKFYNDVGVRAKYLFLRQESFSLSVFGGTKINNFDPFILQGRAGLGFWTIAGEQFALNGSLGVGVGITNRDLVKQDTLELALQPSFNFTPQVAGFLNTGFATSFASFGDFWRIPIGFGALYTLDKSLDLGGDLTFPIVFGGNSTGTLAARQLDLFVRYRFESQ
jgi:hypothetical protein